MTDCEMTSATEQFEQQEKTRTNAVGEHYRNHAGI